MYSELFLTPGTFPCRTGVALRKRRLVKNVYKFLFITEKTAYNFVMNISTIMIFGGILEVV